MIDEKDEKEVNQDPDSPLIYIPSGGLYSVKQIVRINRLGYPHLPIEEQFYIVEFTNGFGEKVYNCDLDREALINKWVKFI